MASNQPEQDWRYQEIRFEPFYFQVTFGFAATVIAVLIGFALFPNDMGYKSNLYTTALGVLVTVAVIDLLNRRRDAKNEEQQLKAKLIEDLGSTINDIACRAAEKLGRRGWLNDGTLRGADLEGANLENAMLVGADLKQAKLANANLKGAWLVGANLDDVDFGYFRAAGFEVLKESSIQQVEDTQKAIEYFEGLDKNESVNQVLTILKNLLNDTQRTMHIYDLPQLAEFDETTVLPDGALWTSETDLSVFTRLAGIPKNRFKEFIISKAEKESMD